MSSEDTSATGNVVFLQQRIARFGLTVAVIAGLALIGRIVLALAFDYLETTLSHPTFWAHAAAIVPVTLVWLLCRSRPLERTWVITIEAIGLVLTSIAFVVMGAYLPEAAGAAVVTAYSLSFALFARAIFVPSAAKHTMWLGVAMGVPLVIAVYWNFLDVDLEVWRSFGFFREIESKQSLAMSQAIQVGISWALTTLLATWATKVIYGLRQDVRDAKKLGQYTLEAKLGEGGMGVVYRAQHGLLKRPTAIKLLLDDRTTPDDLKQFRREVQLTAKLTHPNTVTIYDYGHTDDGTFYYAMELLEGATLEEIINLDGPQPAARVAHILKQCAMALEEAHAFGLVHRDIKPNNIMLTRQGGEYDVAKLLDFGLVKAVNAAVDVSQTGMEGFQGTPLFMSPEQILDPESVDHRCDLYALGAVGYYLLTGRWLFDAMGAAAIITHHVSTIPPPPSARIEREIHSGLEQIVMDCLEKNRNDRPASAAELARRLDALALDVWPQSAAKQWWDTRGVELLYEQPNDDDADPMNLATVQAALDNAFAVDSTE